MEIKQVYEIVNTATQEAIGESAVVNEDLSNIVDIGTQIFNASAFDAYVKSLVNHIGKVIFVNRPYRGSAPSVLMDAWEYGSVVEKISSEMPEIIGTCDRTYVINEGEIAGELVGDEITQEAIMARIMAHNRRKEEVEA